MSQVPSGKYWFCMKHRTVEPTAGCPNADRIGPFPSQAEAANALATIAARERAYEAEEPEDEQNE